MDVASASADALADAVRKPAPIFTPAMVVPYENLVPLAVPLVSPFEVASESNKNPIARTPKKLV